MLHIDLENRPLAYLGHDFTTAEITALAVSWANERRVYVWLLGRQTTAEMLDAFRPFWEAADIVTGHYLLRHDVPILNGAMLEYRRQPLGPKHISDTYVHLAKRKDISVSQENLSMMFGLPEAKHHMSNAEWREANRLTTRGIALTRKRVVDDVIQHKALRAHLLSIDVLKPARLWKP